MAVLTASCNPSPRCSAITLCIMQRPEDRILQVLVWKTETIKKELGSLSQVIDARLAKTLSQGIRRKTIERLASEIETADLDAGPPAHRGGRTGSRP